MSDYDPWSDAVPTTPARGLHVFHWGTAELPEQSRMVDGPQALVVVETTTRLILVDLTDLMITVYPEGRGRITPTACRQPLPMVPLLGRPPVIGERWMVPLEIEANPLAVRWWPAGVVVAVREVSL